MQLKPLNLILCLMTVSSTSLVAQTSITQFGVAAVENFNTFEGTALTVPSRLTFSGNDFDPGGFYNFEQAYQNSNSTYAFRLNAQSTDIAFGEKGPTSGSRFLNWAFVNNTGTEISTFVISWTALQYSAAGRASTITQNYNVGQGFVQTGLSNNVFTASTDSNTGGVQLTSLVAQDFSYTLVLGVPLAQGAAITFGWAFGNGAGSVSNAHIAVDNLSITAIPEPSTYTALAGAMALSMVLLRRRRRASVTA